MNHIYKVVFNKSKGVFTVVSENAKSRCKSTKRSVLSKGEVDSTSSQLKYKLGLVALSVTLGLSPIAANASIAISKTTNPSTGTVNNNNNDTYTAKFAGNEFDGDRSLNYHNPGNPYYDKEPVKPEEKKLHSPDGDKKAGQTIAIGRDANPVRGSTTKNGKTYDIGSGIAIGDFSKATGGLSIGLGHFSQATETGAIAVGTSSLASGFNSLAVMRQSAATADYAMALGTTSYAKGEGSLAVGFSSQAEGLQSIAIGSAKVVKKNSAGSDAQVATFDNKTNTVATGDYAIALGAQSKGEGKSSIAVGLSSEAKQESSVALGTSSKAEGKSSVAVGLSSQAKEESSVALGESSKAEGKSSIALGLSSEAKKESSVALGSKSKAEGKSSVAVGLSSQAKLESAVALGTSSKAEGKSSIALGLSSEAKKESSIAIGNKAIVDNKNSVALGAGSKDKAVSLDTAKATVGEFTYSGFAAVQTTTENGVVSFGDAGKERQLVNVAAGAIKADSTDGINGSQLYFVAKTITDNTPFEYVDGEGKKVVKLNDKFYPAGTILKDGKPVDDKGNEAVESTKIVVKAKGKTPQTVSNIASNLPVVNDLGDKNLNGQAPVAVAKPTKETLAKIKNNAATVEDVLNTGFNLQSNGEAKDFVKAYDTVNFVDGDGTKVVVESDGIKSTVKYSIDKGTISTADGKLVGTPEADKNQADEALKTAKAAADAAPNDATKKAELAKAQAKVDAINNKVATVENVVEAVNNAGFTFGANVDKNNATAENKKLSKLGSTVEVVKATTDITESGKTYKGNNLITKLTQEENGNTKIEIGLNDKPEFTTITAKDGENTSVIDKDGLTIKHKADPKTPGDKDKTVSLTKDGLDNGGNQIVNVAAGTKDTDAVNLSQLKDLDTKLTDNSPFEYLDGDKNKVVKLGDKFYPAGTVLKDGKPVDAAGKPAVESQNIVINAKGTTPQTISNIASNLPVVNDLGDTNLDGKAPVAVAKPKNADAIKNNAATVGDILNTGFNLQGNGEAKDFVKAYDTVDFVDGVGTKVSVESDGVKSTVKYSIDNGKLSTNTNGVAEVDIQDEIAKAKDAVTKAQAAAEADKTNVGLQTKLKEAKALQAKLQEKAESKNVATKALTSAETALNAAKDKLKANPENAALKNDVLAKQKALETAEAKLQEVAKDINAIQNDKVATVSNVIDAINESSFNVTSGKEGTGEVSGTKVDKVKAGNTVTFKAGDNLKLVQDGKNFTYSLKDEVALTDKDGNKTVINGNGLTVTPKDATKKPVSLTKDGLDNGGNQIVNVAAGTKDTDAVNLSQLKDLDAKFTDNSPFEYLDGDKNKVVKLGDKFYPAGTTLDAKGNPVKDGKPVKPAENVVINAKGTTPQTISNIASNLPVTNDKGKVLDKNGKPTNVSVEKPNDAKLAKIKNNAATVEDVLNTGFNLQGNGEAKDFVKAYDTVDFVDGVGTKVAVESDGVKSTVKYSIDKGTITAVDGKLVGTSEADKAKAKDALDAAKAAVDAAPNDEAKKAELAKAQAKVDAINNKVATVENVVETVNTIVDRGSISTRDDGIAVADVKPTAAIEAKEEELLNAINELMTLEAAGEDTSTVESKVAQIKEDLQELKDNSSVNQLATVKNVADAINNSSFNVVAGAEGTGVVENNTSEKVKAGDTVALKAGDNLKLVQDGKNFTYSLKDVVTLTNKDGTAGVALNGKDGTIGLNGKDGSDATIGVQAGKAGLDGAEGTTKTRIVYETKDGTKEEVATLNDGLIFGADSGTEYKAKLGSKVNVQGDGTNISTKVEGNNISVKLSNNIKVDGATIAKNFVVQNGATINLGNNVVNNVADGEVSATSKQAINGSQLYNVQSKINGRINKVDKDLRAGVAGAMATAGLPQVYTPGKSMVAVAGGTYQGQNAVALGVSRISDNGKVIIKLSGNADSRGKFGATIGAGYQW